MCHSTHIRWQLRKKVRTCVITSYQFSYIESSHKSETCFSKKNIFLLTIHNVRVTILYMYRGYYAILSREEIQFVDGESAVEVGA